MCSGAFGVGSSAGRRACVRGGRRLWLPALGPWVTVGGMKKSRLAAGGAVKRFGAPSGTRCVYLRLRDHWQVVKGRAAAGDIVAHGAMFGDGIGKALRSGAVHYVAAVLGAGGPECYAVVEITADCGGYRGYVLGASDDVNTGTASDLTEPLYHLFRGGFRGLDGQQVGHLVDDDIEV